VTATITKPCDTPAPAPAKPTGGADGSWPKPGYGKPTSTLVVVVTPVPAAEYSAYINKPAASAPAAPGSWAKPSYGAPAGADSSAIAKPVAGTKSSDSWPVAAASGTKAGSYGPQFTGAASRTNVGLGLFAGVAIAAVAAF
jgi:hypothetical protein